MRQVDFALYRKRLEAFDFDLVTIRIPDFAIPSATDYGDLFGSKEADVPGSSNYRGVKDPAVDAALKAMEDAKTYERDARCARALDRVVMHQHYQVPQLFSPGYFVSYWNKFGMPAVQPKYLPHGRVFRELVARRGSSRRGGSRTPCASAGRPDGAESPRCSSTSPNACC